MALGLQQSAPLAVMQGSGWVFLQCKILACAPQAIPSRGCVCGVLFWAGNTFSISEVSLLGLGLELGPANLLS